MNSEIETRDHIARVQQLLRQAMEELSIRSLVHDNSKLESPEKEGFDEVTGALKNLTYGSEEYRTQLLKLKPALDHHYANNSHHPEYYQNGIDGMSLLDLIEMLADWKAAGERHADGSMARSLELNKDRFKISPQLQSILTATVKEMNWL